MGKPNTPRIFATLASSTLAGLEALAGKVDSPEVGLELRLDHLKEPNGLESALDQMFSRLHSPPIIATCRRTEAGGLFGGTIEQQGSLLAAAVRAGCQWVDVEIESVERAGVAWLEQFKPAKVIVSYHNYRAAPPLPAIYRRLARLPVQSVKVACHVRRLCDNLRILDLLKSHRNRARKLVALGMGGTGIPSRVLALRYGSAFTYGSAGNHLSVAPGQLPSEVMRTVYRVEHLDRRTQLFGVVGSRASLSLSPAMQNAAFHGKHIDAVYLPCETDRLADFLAFARKLNFQGFSVTMPFKRSIIRALDWLDPLAARIGACNTVAVQRGKWLGWNTDAAAVVEVLTKRLRLAGSRILILGAGGAARAAAYTLRAEGAVVLIAARRDSAAQRLARGISAQVVPWESTEVIDVDAVINATPVGMTPQVDARPIDLSRVRARVVFDMVYHPLETRFLTQARGRGLITISGLEMLVAQGARQFEIWTGSTAPRALMEQAARQVLSHAGA
ncbi:MAG TPA: shikimate dehydrogenase [Terriglobia bacterium]|nr:shikimate dehydrogenase [Terriglobia bacterium]